jgi:endonuclease/exonuclease/phosphatase family metal-dependent hydrolase
MNITFISLNTWNGGVLFDDLVNFLRQQDADIVALQEVYNGIHPTLPTRYRTLQQLEKQLDYPYSDFVADYLETDCDTENCERGNAILSKFPILERRAIFFDKPYNTTFKNTVENAPNCPRNIQHVTLDTPGGLVNAYNIHGVWDLDGDNFSPARQKMCEAIIEATKDERNVILAGDTNARPTNKAIKDLQPYLHSVSGDTLKSTFNMRRKDHPGYAVSAVDMMFTSFNVKVASKACPDVDISDHLPLVATLKIS